jgi:hypothetical protein
MVVVPERYATVLGFRAQNITQLDLHEEALRPSSKPLFPQVQLGMIAYTG